MTGEQAAMGGGIPGRLSENGGYEIKKILVPLDGSATAEAVLPVVTEMASAMQPEVLLVSAVTPVAVWDPNASAIKWEAEEAAAGDYVRAATDQLAGRGLNVRCIVAFGGAAEVILRVAEDDGVDLIAMTTHGRSGIARWVMGSVADKVLRNTRVPLLLVRPPETTTPDLPTTSG